jgi:hypothetical protein
MLFTIENFWKVATVASVALSIPIAGIQQGNADQREFAKLGTFMCLTGIAGYYAASQKHLPSEWEEEIERRLQSLSHEEENLKRELAEIGIQKNQIDEETRLIDAKWQALRQAEANIDTVITQQVETLTVKEVARLQNWENDLIRQQADFDVRSQQTKQEIEADFLEKRDSLEKHLDDLTAKHERVVSQLQGTLEQQKELIYLLDAPRFPNKRETMAEVYCHDFIRACLVWEPKIKADCYERQPMDDGKSFNFWLKLRDNNHGKDIRSDDFRNWIALQCKFPVQPYITMHPSEGTIEVQIPHNLKAYKPPKEYQIKVTTNQVVGSILKPASGLYDFVTNQNHITVWGSTGEGKTTLVANIIGAMSQTLGKNVRIITTIPKIDSDTQKLFPSIDYLGFRNSIYGLLEAATELVYRNQLGIEAYQTKQDIPEFQPLIYFLDEYSEIASRWNSTDKEEFETVIATFKAGLDVARRKVFECEMEGELKHTNFASRLLLFGWRVGRALKVKFFIFGQNLMPTTLKVNKVDLENSAFICMPKCVKFGVDYRVRETEATGLNSDFEKIKEVVNNNEELRYYALFIGTSGQPYYAQLPAPNTFLIPGDMVQVKPLTQAHLDGSDDGLDQKDCDTSNNTSNHLATTPDTERLDIQGLGSSNDATLVTVSVVTHLDALSKINSRCLNLANKPEIEVWRNAPKNLKGDIKKTSFYGEYGIKNSKHRKIASDFIDYLDRKYSK